MPDTADDLIKRLISNCDRKRTGLMDRALSHQRASKHLHMTSAVIALLSGAGMTAVLADIVPGTSTKVVSALLAFVSGLINVYTTVYLDSKDTNKMFKGATLFLALKQRAETLSASAKISEDSKL